jgi:uncharacterized membrane protein
MSIHKLALVGLLGLGLLLPVRADEPAVPSFKKSKDKDTKEFVGKVFESIVKVARLKTKNYKVEKYEYVNVKDKPNRKELHITGTWDGALVSKNVKTNITIKLDTSDKDAWEVLSIEYKDALRTSAVKHNQNNIDALVKTFNQ